MRKVLAVIFISSLIVMPGKAQTITPKPISPDSVQWNSMSTMPGVQAAWLVGSIGKSGLYILRVKIKSGATIAPHTHPDERSTTVLSGTIYVGFGETVDLSKTIAVHTGSVYVVPANMPHYILTKDNDALYQESGYGPTANKMMEKH